MLEPEGFQVSAGVAIGAAVAASFALNAFFLHRLVAKVDRLSQSVFGQDGLSERVKVLEETRPRATESESGQFHLHRRASDSGEIHTDA